MITEKYNKNSFMQLCLSLNMQGSLQDSTTKMTKEGNKYTDLFYNYHQPLSHMKDNNEGRNDNRKVNKAKN